MLKAATQPTPAQGFDTVYFLTAFGRIGQLALEPFTVINPGHCDTSRILLVHPKGIRPGNIAFYNILRRYYIMEPRDDYFQLDSAETVALGSRELRKLFWVDQARCICQFFSKVRYDGLEPVFYSLTEEETARGQALQGAVGIPPGEPFVCLHMREPNYIRLAHHNHRDMAPETFRPAIDHLLNLGIWVVRIGDTGMTPLPSHPRLVDLPFLKLGDDLADIWFATRCLFMIGNTSGPHILPAIFNGPPVLVVNSIGGSSMSFNDQDRFIPKLLYSKQEGRYLTMSEIMYLGDTMKRSHFYEEAGLTIVDNTAEEILEAVEEMLADLRSGRPADQSGNLQAQYRAEALGWHRLKALKGECEPYYLYGPPLASSFLDRHAKHLLPDMNV